MSLDEESSRRSLEIIRGNIRGCLEASHALLLETLLRKQTLVGWRQFLRDSNRIGTYGTACGLLAYSTIAPYDIDTIRCVAACLAQIQRGDGSWESPTIADGVGLTTATCYAIFALRNAPNASVTKNAIESAEAWLAARIKSDGSVGHTATDCSPYTICSSLTIRALSSASSQGHTVELKRAASWLLDSQNADGGFGATKQSRSTLHHTCEAILALDCLPDEEVSTAIANAGAFLIANHRLGDNRHQDTAYISANIREAILPHTYQTDGLLLQAHLRLHARTCPSKFKEIALHLIAMQKDGYWQHDLHPSRVPSWSVMECTLGLSEFLSLLQNDELGVTVLQSGTGSAIARYAILVISTEWKSRNGGLSTFNREICKALARSGNSVVCFVPQAEISEHEDAATANVTLCVPPGESEAFNDLLYRRPPLPAGFLPNVVVGHGRITGNYARAQVTDNFPDAQRVHFLHMIPAEIEWYKAKADASQIAEDRMRQETALCRNAISVGVGKRIVREFATHFHGMSIPVHQFTPGLNCHSGNDNVPPGIRCLVLGRAEDLELKGLDIAARAVSLLPHPTPHPFESEPQLCIRGAQSGTGTELQQQLQKFVAKRIEIRVFEYSSDQDVILCDIQSASIVLMPSRAEGFGLVALEALGAGRPILVSDRSGFGELLLEVGSESARQFVVATTGDLNIDGENWSKALERLLRDRDSSFRLARNVRQELSSALNWDRSVSGLLHVIEERGLQVAMTPAVHNPKTRFGNSETA